MSNKRNKLKDTEKIYIDTNVLIDYFTKQKDVVDSLNYIFSKRRKEVLFTSSLSIVQTLCNLQTKKKVRKAFTKQESVKVVDFYLKKVSILDLTKKDIEDAKNISGDDIEDCVQYVISKKKKCTLILTKNTSDFYGFEKVIAVKPNLSILKHIFY